MAKAVKGSWWVGENLTNQNSFRTHNFFSNNAPSGYQAVQAGNDQDAAAFAQSLKSGQDTPPLHAIVWHIVGGPYDTEAQATAAIPGIQSKTPAPGEGQQLLSGPLSGLEGIATMLGLIGKLFSALFDPAMWWSLGWLFAGLVLFLIGTWLLAGKPPLPMPIPI